MAIKAEKRFSMNSSLDDPPNSRLFIIGSKLLTEKDFQEAFKSFGRIEEIWILKDKTIGQSKGVTYIKYSKTSEAARALETMNGKCIGNLNQTIRVMIASSRDEGSKKELNEEEKIQRLFIVVPRTMTQDEVYEHFQTFGHIDYVTIVRDKETHESKGFAYVKYFKFSHAAEAFENCDRKYRPVFAAPRRQPSHHPRKDTQPLRDSCTSIDRLPLPDLPPSAVHYTRLVAIVSAACNQDQLWRLFDLVPGLDYCHLNKEDGAVAVAYVAYGSPQAAAYAREKLHGFEYPLGSRIIVKPDVEGGDDVKALLDRRTCARGDVGEGGERDGSFGSGTSQDYSPSTDVKREANISCSIDLPDPQPLASSNEPTVSRCFIVCRPNPLPGPVLKNIFSRFPNLIDVYLLNNRNCGFAMYSCKESADRAIETLHGAEICGIRIKVLKAEERKESNRKRQRMEDK